MIDHPTLGIEATEPGTGVPAVLADAGQRGRTLLADHTLRSTLDVGVAGVVPTHLQEAAPLCWEHSAFRPQGEGLQGSTTSTGLSATRKTVCQTVSSLTCLTWRLAAGERIPHVARPTDTVRDVVPHVTVGVQSTEPRTGVDTGLVLAGLVSGTVRAVDTLRTTVGRRADHAWQAGAVTPGSLDHWRAGV